MTTKSLREGTLSFGKERLGFSHKKMGTHSIRSWFFMKLSLAKVYPETIMIMGQWARSAFLRCIRIQVSDLSKCISTLMTTNQALYTIPKIEFVYHTPGVNNTDPQRLIPNRRGWEHITSSLSLPLWNCLQGSKYHATAHIHWAATWKYGFIPFTLGVNFPESRITREDGGDFSFWNSNSSLNSKN